MKKIEYLKFLLLINVEHGIRQTKHLIAYNQQCLKSGGNREKCEDKLQRHQIELSEKEKIIYDLIGDSSSLKLYEKILEQWNNVLVSLNNGEIDYQHTILDYLNDNTLTVEELKIVKCVETIRTNSSEYSVVEKVNKNPLYMDIIHSYLAIQEQSEIRASEINIYREMLFDIIKNRLYNPNQKSDISSNESFWGLLTYSEEMFSKELYSKMEEVFLNPKTNYYIHRNGSGVQTIWINESLNNPNKQEQRNKIQLLKKSIIDNNYNIIECDYGIGNENSRYSIISTLYENKIKIKDLENSEIGRFIDLILQPETIQRQVMSSSKPTRSRNEVVDMYIELIKKFSPANIDKKIKCKNVLDSIRIRN